MADLRQHPHRREEDRHAGALGGGEQRAVGVGVDAGHGFGIEDQAHADPPRVVAAVGDARCHVRRLQRDRSDDAEPARMARSRVLRVAVIVAVEPRRGQQRGVDADGVHHRDEPLGRHRRLAEESHDRGRDGGPERRVPGPFVRVSLPDMDLSVDDLHARESYGQSLAALPRRRKARSSTRVQDRYLGATLQAA